MQKGWLPPYFAQLSVATMLISAVCLGMALAMPAADDAGVSEGAEVVTQEIAPIAEDDEVDEEDETDEPATARMTLPLRDAAFPVIVGGTTLTEPELRHNLLEFRRTILSIEQGGYAVGVVIRDMDTGAYLAYAPDRDLYPASCIKAPYVVSVYERLVDTGKVSADVVSSLAAPTIIYSDNDTYRALSDLCGRQVFVDWAADCHAFKRDGVRYNQLAAYRYSLLRPRQLARMWQRTFTYLNSGTAGATQLADYFERREVSPIRQALPDATKTITKAGWYPLDSGPLYAATNDAGIVVMGGHTYLLVIMTSIPDDLGRLTQLVPGIFSATAALV